MRAHSLLTVIFAKRFNLENTPKGIFLSSPDHSRSRGSAGRLGIPVQGAHHQTIYR